MLETALKQIIGEKRRQGVVNTVILNFLREYIQYLVLNFLYNQKIYKKLVFKGGSCLRICFGLPRLSEDLDFDYSKQQINIFLLKEMEKYLQEEIKSKYFPLLETKKQSTKRLYLKFPLLHNLGLAQKPESDKLYLKIETDDQILPKAKFELTPISKFGFNFILRHYDLPTLMAGKIQAVLSRLWFKGEKQEIDIKGRDFYDLFWFLENGIEPNWQTMKKITNIENKEELKTILRQRIKAVITPQKLNYDLKNFIADQQFVSDFSQNYHQIIKKYLN